MTTKTRPPQRRPRPISARVRARDLAKQIENAACREWGVLWSHFEAAHRKATTPDEAAAAASPAMQLCMQCDQHVKCDLLATLGKYTGLAAGGAYRNGRRLESVDVVVHEGKPPQLAEAS